MKIIVIALIAVIATIIAPTGAAAQQSDYGQRLQSRNGWLTPVATRILCSDEEKHIGRGSVNAWDLCAPYASAIYAMAPGVVSYAGCNNAGGYGCWVLLNHSDGYSSSYGHMIQGSIRVKQGQQVDANTLLGQIGWTGMTSFGPHVHWEIRHTGQFIRIDQFFDINAMRQCNLCSVSGEPVTANGIAQSQQQQPQQQPVNRLIVVLQAIAQTPTNQVGSVVFVVTMGIGFILWLGGMWIRVAIVGLGSGLVGAVVVAMLLVPVATVAANQQAPAVGGDKAWEWAYPIIQRNEGWSCTNDGAYTMGGVTQGTYNRWRRLHGMGAADVCANLTREQAKAIYYELFWLGSGSDRLPATMGLAVTDHYIVTGKVAHLVAQCGADIECFHNARIVDFQSKSNCYLYCRAWINRVNNVRKITQSFQ